ncbi:MAG: hypothetical protein J5367_01605 [Lachnospiraceae bacterium]|nr:hypothetical protein [Lachnospiraceae bacterium]
MKGFGKFVTFVGITGAALAGLWYFCEVNKDKCECACDDDALSSEKKSSKERSYVSLDPEVKEQTEEVIEDAKKVAKEAKDVAKEGKDTLKKAVKSAAADMLSKAEDKARGVGLVKEDKKTSDFEFEDFDKESSHIDIQ